MIVSVPSVSIVCTRILSAPDAIVVARSREGEMAMKVVTLVERCTKSDGAAEWSQLWTLVEQVARPCFLWLLAKRHLSADWANDLLQELYLHIQTEKFRRLKMFRGNTLGELNCFLRPMARNMALDLLEKWQRIEVREMAAARQVPFEGHDGPTISAVEKTIKELNSILSPEERCRLTAVAPARDFVEDQFRDERRRRISARTLRRWQCELHAKYRDRF
jgi:DNA-directed RNA polymerase specialized sigma24 family protein